MMLNHWTLLALNALLLQDNFCYERKEGHSRCATETDVMQSKALQWVDPDFAR